MDSVRGYRFEIVLVSLVFLILGPLVSTILQLNIRFVNVFGLSLLSIASLNMAVRKIPRIFSGAMGIMTLIIVWLEFLYPTEFAISLLRMCTMLGLFASLSYILIRNFLDAIEVTPKMIFVGISGFILIGFLGGVFLELLNHFQEGAVLIDTGVGGFDLYYYSFISMMTVGYGDIIPISGAAKSLTIILGLSGQLYMTIGITTIVGKHLNSMNKTK